LRRLPRQRVAIHRQARHDRVRRHPNRREDDDVVFRPEFVIARDVLSAGIGVRDAQLIERESPPTFVLRIEPGMHQRHTRNFDWMRLHYRRLADRTTGVTFVGRLATYKYYNMDQIVAQALTTYGKIAGLKRVEASLHGNGNGNGHKPTADPFAIPGIAMTPANR